MKDLPGRSCHSEALVSDSVKGDVCVLSETIVADVCLLSEMYVAIVG